MIRRILLIYLAQVKQQTKKRINVSRMRLISVSQETTGQPACIKVAAILGHVQDVAKNAQNTNMVAW